MIDIKKNFIYFKSIFKNFSYNLSYQILSLVLPIITVPYITRIFTQSTVGLNAVIQANCSYFVLIGMLGINYLGSREIANCLGNKKKITIKFFSIFKIQLISHIISLLVYIFYCAFSNTGKLAYIYILYILSSMFDISWFYMGIEDFKSISHKNIFVKFLSFVLLFVCIKSERDIYMYIYTLYLPQIIINIYMWRILFKKNIKFIKTGFINLYYVKEAVSLLIPQIASSIYTILDKTILGVLATYSTVAIYVQAQTLLRLFLGIMPSFSRVMIPRISSSLAKNDDEETFKYMKLSAEIIGALSFLVFFGVLACAQLFVDWYLPSDYSQTGSVMRICSPIILLVGGSNLIAIQYLIPKGKQRQYTVSIFVATTINIILNIFLIPILGIYGVCVGSVIAELVGFLMQLYFVKSYLSLRQLFEHYPIYFCVGIGMFCLLYHLSLNITSTIINILFLAFIGCLIYFLGIIVVFKLLKTDM